MVTRYGTKNTLLTPGRYSILLCRHQRYSQTDSLGLRPASDVQGKRRLLLLGHIGEWKSSNMALRVWRIANIHCFRSGVGPAGMGSCCDGNSLLLITTSANGLCGRRDIIRELNSAYPPPRIENETVRLPSTSRSHAGSSSQKRPKSGAGFVVDETSSENSACLPYPLKLRMTSRIHAGSSQKRPKSGAGFVVDERDMIRGLGPPTPSK